MNKNDSQEFLEQLESLGADTFEGHFCQASKRYGLGDSFTRNELVLLYETAFLAVRCNEAFNAAEIRGCDESQRVELEIAFMEARDMLHASPGWQVLPEAERQLLELEFLAVQVHPDKLRF